MKIVLSHIVSFRVQYFKELIKLSIASMCVRCRIKALYYRPVLIFFVVEFCVVGFGYSVWSAFTEPEVYRSYVSREVVKVVDRDGFEYEPKSPQAQKILKGSYEPVWVQ